MATQKWNTQDRVTHAELVTPSDSAENNYDALFVGTLGDLEILPVKSTVPVVLKNIGSGEFIPVPVKKVLSGNTSASNIVGLIIER